jgi:YD repeat-containing protein
MEHGRPDLLRLSFLFIILLSLLAVMPGHARAQSGDLTYVYDESGRLIAVIDPAGDTARYSYDAVGNLLSISRQSSSTVSIISFTPTTGPIGASVTIYGTAFSATAGQNTVAFNGVAATVISASVTQIVATVPVGATTGLITIDTPAGSGTSSMPFTVSGSKAPTISGFNPTFGDPGTAVNITGTNFETIPANNHVTFNGTLGPVTSATATSLTASAPSQPGMGRISVSTPFGAALSNNEFFIPPPEFNGDIESTSWIAVDETKVVTVATVGNVAVVFFHGTAGHRMSIELSAVTAGVAFVITPNGTQLTYGGVGFGGGLGLVDLASLPTTGTYAIVVSPRDNNNFRSTGSMTLTLHNVPPDVTGTIVAGGPPVTVTTTVPGQNALLTFTGAVGQNVSLDMNGVTIANSNIFILGPDSSDLASMYSVTTSGGHIDPLTLPFTGAYQIFIDPQLSYIGSMTLALNNVTASAPTITGFTPTIGSEGTTVTIAGTNFEPVSANNTVTFNGRAASVNAASSTSIGTSVPAGATSGHIRVTTPAGSAVSSDDFFIAPSPYTAADLAFTDRITFGQGKTATISTANKIGIVLFDGTAGQRVSLQINDSTFAGCLAVYDTIKNPDGTNLASIYICGATGYIDTVVLPQTGTYTILIDPEGANTGSQTLLLSDVPADATGTITPGGAAVTVTTTTAGQNAVLTFSGTAGQRVSLQISNSTFAGCLAAFETIKNPDGTNLASIYICGATGYIDTVVLPVTGSYTILIDPQGTTIGSQSLQLNDVPADVAGTITPGGAAVTVTTTTAGQNAVLTFSGTAGQRVSLQISNSTFAGCLAAFETIKNPDGTNLASIYICGATGYIDTVVLPQTGTYTILVDPQGTTIGSQSLQLNDVPADATGTITPGGAAVTVTTTTAGQNAVLTFSGTAGQRVSLQISNSTFAGCLAAFDSIRKPDGTNLASIYICGATGYIDTVVLPVTGSYTILIDPQGTTSGSQTLLLNDVLD